jgi:hypothetical protein
MTRQPIRVLYIAGFGRSGSTVLERVLGNVPGFLAAGEVRYVWHRGFENDELCSCGQAFSRCPFWARVVESFGPSEAVPYARLAELVRTRARIRSIPMLRQPSLRNRMFEEQRAELSEGLTRLYRGLSEVSQAGVVVDSSKDPAYAFLLASIPDIDLHVVHLTRDSRAVAHSWSKRVVRPEVTKSVEYMALFSPGAAARQWNVKNVLCGLLRSRARSYIRISYEDFATDPASAVSRILHTVGEQHGAAPRAAGDAYVVPKPSSYHTVSGNPVRLEHGAVRIRLDDEWRTQLPRRSKLIVTALTLPLLVRYGYEL